MMTHRTNPLSIQDLFSSRNWKDCLIEIERYQKNVEEYSLEFLESENIKLQCQHQLEISVSFQNLIEICYNQIISTN
jgi:hypothetical protein